MQQVIRMLSIETLYFCSLVSRASILSIFVVILASQPGARYFWHWSTALVSCGSGALIALFCQCDAFSDSLVSACFSISFLTSWSGLRIFFGKTVDARVLLTLLLLPYALQGLGFLFGLTEKMMLPWINLFAASLAILSVYEIARAKGPIIYSKYLVALAFSGYALVLSLTAVLILGGWVAAERTSGLLASLIFDQVAGILVYFGYIAMWSERAFLELKNQAETDPLTGLANRRRALQVLNSIHSGSQAGIYSVIIGDADHFKRINDTYGHCVGDHVLKILGRRLSNAIRRTDLAVRWGGEEFLIILPHTGLDEAELLAERLRARVASPDFVIDHQHITVTISLGVACSSGQSVESTLLQADLALYSAKRDGRNRVNSYAPTGGM